MRQRIYQFSKEPLLSLLQRWWCASSSRAGQSRILARRNHADQWQRRKRQVAHVSFLVISFFFSNLLNCPIRSFQFVFTLKYKFSAQVGKIYWFWVWNCQYFNLLLAYSSQDVLGTQITLVQRVTFNTAKKCLSVVNEIAKTKGAGVRKCSYMEWNRERFQVPLWKIPKCFRWQ